MQRRTVLQGAFGAVVAATTGAALVGAARSSGRAEARSTLTLIAPAAPGGGWDGFAREAQQVLRSASIVNNAQVVNIPGAGGTIGLSQFVGMTGAEDTLMVTGGVMVGAIALGEGDASFEDVTPVARLADDFAALVVPADSEIQDLDGFLEALTSDDPEFSIASHRLQGLPLRVGRSNGVTPPPWFLRAGNCWSGPVCAGRCSAAISRPGARPPAAPRSAAALSARSTTSSAAASRSSRASTRRTSTTSPTPAAARP